MSSKFRPLYDKLYMGLDVFLLAKSANKDARKRAKRIEKNSKLDEAYKTKVKPFWKQYCIKPKKSWYRIYCEKADRIDPRFIPDDIWFREIIPHYNYLLFAQALQDKCLHNMLVPGVKRPATVVKNISGIFYDDNLSILTEEEAINRCMAAERFIIKPSVGSGKGADVNFYNGSEMSASETKAMFSAYKDKNFIVQLPVKQHKVLSDIYDKSLNTIRVVSFLYNNEVHILSCILRMGSGGSEIDNVSRGGYAVKVNLDGSLDKYAVNRKAEWVTCHPGGTVFETVKIPEFVKLLHTVREAAAKVPHFRILGWDFAIDEYGDPVFIEYNVIPGQNQKTWGPTFGDMTEDILNEVFQNKQGRKRL